MNHGKLATIALICFLTTGCSPRFEKTFSWPFAEDQFVFIEFQEINNGRVLEGEYPIGRRIDSPTYMFDSERNILASREFSFEIDDTLKVIFGRRLTLHGIAGSGIDDRLHGVYGFPYYDRDIILIGIDENGSAHVEFQDERLIIEINNEWTNNVTFHDTLDTSYDKAIAEFTKTIRIVNHGVLEKANLRGW